jgi:hypothetical protein
LRALLIAAEVFVAQIVHHSQAPLFRSLWASNLS